MLATVAACGNGGKKEETDSEGFVNESQIKLPELEIDSDKVYMLTWEDPSVLTTPSAYMYTVNEKLKQEYGVSVEYIRTTNTEIETKAAVTFAKAAFVTAVYYIFIIPPTRNIRHRSLHAAF